MTWLVPVMLQRVMVESILLLSKSTSKLTFPGSAGLIASHTCQKVSLWSSLDISADETASGT